MVSPRQDGKPRNRYIDKEKKREKGQKRELHELPYKEMVKSGTVRLTVWRGDGGEGWTIFLVVLKY